MLVTNMSASPMMFSTLSEGKSHHFNIIKLSSENDFNLDKSKILLFGKELIHYGTGEVIQEVVSLA